MNKNYQYFNSRDEYKKGGINPLELDQFSISLVMLNMNSLVRDGRPKRALHGSSLLAVFGDFQDMPNDSSNNGYHHLFNHLGLSDRKTGC